MYGCSDILAEFEACDSTLLVSHPLQSPKFNLARVDFYPVDVLFSMTLALSALSSLSLFTNFTLYPSPYLLLYLFLLTSLSL